MKASDSPPDSSTEALRRLLGAASVGGQEKVDALVALTQSRVYLPTLTEHSELPVTVFDKDGLEALPVFTGLDSLQYAGRQFEWCETLDVPAHRRVEGREAFQIAKSNGYQLVLVDVCTDTTLSVEPSEFTVLIGAGGTQPRGPYAGAGKVSSTLIKRVKSGQTDRNNASAYQSRGSAIQHGAVQHGAVQHGSGHCDAPTFDGSKTSRGSVTSAQTQPVSPGDSPRLTTREAPPPQESQAYVADAPISTAGREPSRKIPLARIPTKKQNRDSTLQLRRVEATPPPAAPTDPASLLTGPGVYVRHYGDRKTTPRSSGPGHPVNPSRGPVFASQDAHEPRSVHVRKLGGSTPSGTWTSAAVPTVLQPQPSWRFSVATHDLDETLAIALSDTLRTYPEVEWACHASLHISEVAPPTPCIGLRLDDRMLERIDEIGSQILAQTLSHNPLLQVILLREPETLRKIRQHAHLFYPWSKRSE